MQVFSVLDCTFLSLDCYHVLNNQLRRVWLSRTTEDQRIDDNRLVSRPLSNQIKILYFTECTTLFHLFFGTGSSFVADFKLLLRLCPHYLCT